MTFCEAVRVGDRIFVVGDAALTHPIAVPFAEYSAFQEPRGVVTGLTKRNVEELALKIVRLGRRLFAFAGNIDVACAAAKLLASNPDLHGEAAFRSINATLGPFETERGIQVLSAVVNKNAPELWRWDAVTGRAVTGEAAWIGSPPKDFNLFAWDFIRQVRGLRDFEPQTVAAVIAAGLQSVSLRASLINDGIGGTFTNAYVGADGAAWQPDMLYVLYNRDEFLRHIVGIDSMEAPTPAVTAAPSQHLVSVFVRGDATLVHPVLVQGEEATKMLAPLHIDAQDALRRVAKQFRSVRKQINEVRFGYVAFVRRNDSSVVLLRTPTTGAHRPLRVSSKHTALVMVPDLVEILARAPGESDPRRLTLVFVDGVREPGKLKALKIDASDTQASALIAAANEGR